MGKSRGRRLKIRTKKLCARPVPPGVDEKKEEEQVSSDTLVRKENSKKKILVKKIIPLQQFSSWKPKKLTPDVTPDKEDDEDEPGGLHIDEEICCSNPEEAATGASVKSAEGISESTASPKETPTNEDVLSVVIQKLTELVKSSETLCPHTETSNIEGCSSGTNTPQKAASSKKKSRSKRYNKSQLYKCPNCPCLFAVRKRDLKKSKEILCDCCEKVKQAEAAEESREEKEASTPLQVVPLESWKVVCDVCSHWLSDYSSLLIHLASHDNVQIFKCKLCDFVTTKKDKIESHQATHRLREINYNKFVCSLCKFSVNDLSKMEKHLKQHDQGKLLVLKCSVCGFTCRSEVVLLYHMVSHIVEPTATKGSQKVGGTSQGDGENNMVFKCSVCGYTCFKLSTLKSHSWKHAGEQSCSYPVEESDDEAGTSKRRKIESHDHKLQETTEAEVKSQESSKVTPEAKSRENKDLSRLAIGCCSSKGQSCCSEEGSKECCCKSISVPPSQQPVLEVILNEIVNKAPAASCDKKSVQEAAEADQGDSSRKEEHQGLCGDTNPEVSGKGQTTDSNGKVQVQTVKTVLAECSSLIKDFCEKVKTTPKKPDEEVSQEHVDDSLNHTKSLSAVQYNSSLHPKQQDSIDTVVTEANKNLDIHNCIDADEDSIIVVVENIDIDNFLENTASVVEVTTSDDLHTMTFETNVGGPTKRLSTTDVDGAPECKKVALSDTSNTNNCLLNVVEEQEEQSMSSKTKDSGEELAMEPHNPIICPFCEEQPATFAHLKRHLLDHCRQEENFKCETCKLIFASESLFLSHQRLQGCKGQTTDSVAGEEADEEGLEMENKELDDVKAKGALVKGTGACTNKTCSHCSRKFRTKAALYLHEQECSSKKKSFPCIECDYVGSTPEEIKEHISASHKKPFKCALCDYTSATPSGIKNHMKFHAVDKPYKCHLCDFSGAYPQSLRSHLKVHATGETDTQVPYEQYKCKLCGYISCHLPSMKSHMWRHARDPGFKYDMMDDIIKDATLISVPEKVPVGQQRLIYVSTPLQKVVAPAQNQIIVATEKSGPVDKAPLKENKPVSESKLPGVTTNAPSILIFKCTQCGFQSDSQGKLIAHLKGHLTQ